MLTWFWRLVFWWKRRTGWVSMNETVMARGIVMAVIPPDVDGDAAFSIRLDPGFQWLITGFGRRITVPPGMDGPGLHCEVPPWMPASLGETARSLRAGDRVEVIGEWGFDGVHTGRAMWLEVLLALVRHQPNVRDGWFEIHPVTKITKV